MCTHTLTRAHAHMRKHTHMRTLMCAPAHKHTRSYAYTQVTVWEPTRLTAGTCNSDTDFRAQLFLFDGLPTEDGALVATNEPGAQVGTSSNTIIILS